GRARIDRWGEAKDVAPAKSATTPTIIITSPKVESKRSLVTGPPIRIPAIQSGKESVGRVKRFVPGIGTPISAAMIIRMMRITAINRSATLNERDHGSSPLNRRTTRADASSRKVAYQGLAEIKSEIPSRIDQAHHAKGWTCSRLR
ncbi:MAG: hypothetical protein RLZZ394_95, partial [Actinomycetota bacterium]